LPKVGGFRNHQFFLLNRDNLKWPFKKGWTQLRLSWEMLKNSPDVLFVPVHTFPIIHPRLIVTIQGLEFERAPKCYSFWQRKKLRFLTQRNAKKAEKIIVPSKCTKNDLVGLYNIKPEKIFVIPHGINKPKNLKSKIQFASPTAAMDGFENLKFPKYILYLGRGDKRKNIDGIVRAFKILKEKYKIPHKLLLAGPNHVGRRTSNIIMMGHVSEVKKWQLLMGADVFVFPSFYEGFGMPVLEAQAVGVPVVASNISSLPEILDNSALMVDSKNPEEIAEAVYKIIKNPELREELVKKGYENVKKFSWEKCAKKTFKIILM